MKLPNSDRALVDLDKLTEYCLNPDHPRGKHKARVFAAALGLTMADASTLRDSILAAGQGMDAEPAESDAYGTRFVVEFDMRFNAIRTLWIVRVGEDFPRLTSCFVV